MNVPHEIVRELKRGPAMYTGEASLAAVKHFLNGYGSALADYHVGEPADREIIPRAFNDWVAYRLHFYESTSGWFRMISETCFSEQERLDRFFCLIDEFYNRQPRVVGRLMNFQGFLNKNPDHTHGRLVGLTGPLEYASSIALVVYTDDPGFFAYREAPGELPMEGFFPSLEAFELRVGASREMLSALDDDWFRRNSKRA